nr:diguanylate cyclase [uncultured Roseateles sp.]
MRSDATESQLGLPALKSDASAHGWVRLAMYAVLLLASAQAGFFAWQAERAQRARAVDAEVAELAGAQRMLSQRIGRLAVLSDGDDTAALSASGQLRASLDRAAAQAQRLDRLIAQLEDTQAEAPDLAQALAAWISARQRLWSRAEALLDSRAQGTAAGTRLLAAQVEIEADPALEAAQDLVDELERQARGRYATATDAARLWALVSVLMFAGLTLGVAEPTARMVRRQYRRLSAQARELERLALVAELTNNAVLITNAERRIVWVNQAFSRITGYGPEEALGQKPGPLLLHEAADPSVRARLSQAIESGQGLRAQFLNRRKDGARLWLDLDLQLLRDEQGALSGFVGVASDITARRQAQAELRVAAIAFESLEAMVVTDANQVILKVNQAFTRITGYSSDEAVGQVTGRLLSSGRHEPAFYAAMWQVLNSCQHWQGEVWNRRRNGEIYPEWLSITAVTDEDGRVQNYVAVFSDITVKKQAEKAIQRLAFYDPLTELPNRRLLRDRLGQVLAASARHQTHAAVLFIDLDRFKELNDSQGHDVGDQLLIEVARRLRANVRANDTVARQGGDEFVVILAELSAQPEQARSQAAAIAEKIRGAINGQVQLGGATYTGSPSIGVCLFAGSDIPVEELLKRADMAMYQAKKSGRNAVRFFETGPASEALLPPRPSGRDPRAQLGADA